MTEVPSPVDDQVAVRVDDATRLRRWRLLLGGEAGDLAGPLHGDAAAMDAALAALYDTGAGGARGAGGSRSAGLGGSAPRVARWLGDIRTYFPSTVVQVMQKDAVDRLGLARLLLEPELLSTVEPNVNLVGTLLSLNRVMPEQTKATARQVVAHVVDEIEQRISTATTSAVTGALRRGERTHRPRPRDIDWDATIRANLRHYLPEHRTVIPQRLVGESRRHSVVARDVVLCIDQSGSMAESVVYASVFGAVLASMRALKTSLVVFDTEVVDLTDRLADPVDVLFGTQLGGGTDINRAIAYSQSLITRPNDSLFVLISDLYEGGVRDEMLRRVATMQASGVQVVVLLALSDSGAPAFDHENAAALAALGVPAFACTPDAFPDLLAVALSRGDVGRWAQSTLGVPTG
ncbi:VWA domain-containing protein [Cellulomonas fimi]|uniref:VWA containing CoxE family protein n=1 Tax=Cellulomonas fimi (strain ATCC 484 / DSM 20113 / JCM 1341 / CCUG 24087 / LMG 16345 / NBRC 15513 / NCIMB 8980 / NCTC 7547 / NRS-133) TaxID=590998 RepID=F4GZH4_CELFA|nr:VWA domain-containing protein [Cellulomonas fimi]AEE44895.1 VWA containing CoxE family protein [Cellulomonas fimi ATCC 484]NNH08267.1 VWA domain-containing protein [Cellulomonas fimi]VEH27607.1 Mg-chelatase subunit ChlD [Cellulomonas fimi]